MKMVVYPPAVFEAERIKEAPEGSLAAYNTRMFRGRSASPGPAIIIEDASGKVVDCCRIVITDTGQIKLDRLVDKT